MHNISVQYKGNIIRMKNFSSQKFNGTFIDRPIPPNIIVTAFEYTNAGDNLKEAIDYCVEIINDNDGFQVVIWFSRGDINDRTGVALNIQEGTQVDAGKITYHIVTIKPEKMNLNDNRTILSSQLESMKFKIGDNF